MTYQQLFKPIAYGLMVLVALSGCGQWSGSSPPEGITVEGDTARVSVPGSGDIRSHELENVRWERPENEIAAWLTNNGFEHDTTSFDTERMESIGYQSVVSEDQTGVRLYGISVWVRSLD